MSFTLYPFLNKMAEKGQQDRAGRRKWSFIDGAAPLPSRRRTAHRAFLWLACGLFVVFSFPFVSLDAKCKHNCRHSAGFVIYLIANAKVNIGMKERDKKNNSNSFRLLFRVFFSSLSTIRHHSRTQLSQKENKILLQLSQLLQFDHTLWAHAQGLPKVF